MRIYEKYCKTCGTKLSDFYRTGMLGCPDCYYAFGAEVFGAVKKVQGKTTHVGKSPKCTGVDRELLAEYKRLLALKEKAGIDGDFAEMNRISSDLFELGEELKRRGLI